MNRSLPGRDNQRATTEAAARALAVGAEALTTDGATLQSGGWDLQADRAPVGQLPQPASLVATGGDSKAPRTSPGTPSGAASKPTSPSKPSRPADPARNATSAKPRAAPSPA